MNSLERYVNLAGGPALLLRGEAVRVTGSGQVLLIEHLGPGPFRRNALSAAQHSEAGSAVILAPVMRFEVAGGVWFPYYYRDDDARFELSAVKPAGRGAVLDRNAQKRLLSLARAWEERINADFADAEINVLAASFVNDAEPPRVRPRRRRRPARVIYEENARRASEAAP